MTRQLNFEGGTEFGRWLRTQKEIDSRKFSLSIQNMDYIVHNFNNPQYHQLMLVEEKTRLGEQSFAQRDTHRLLDMICRSAANKQIVDSQGRKKIFRYGGYHILRFENTLPTNGRMWWDGKPINVDDLYKLLRFEISPFMAARH